VKRCGMGCSQPWPPAGGWRDRDRACSTARTSCRTPVCGRVPSPSRSPFNVREQVMRRGGEALSLDQRIAYALECVRGGHRVLAAICFLKEARSPVVGERRPRNAPPPRSRNVAMSSRPTTASASAVKASSHSAANRYARLATTDAIQRVMPVGAPRSRSTFCRAQAGCCQNENPRQPLATASFSLSRSFQIVLLLSIVCTLGQVRCQKARRNCHLAVTRTCRRRFSLSESSAVTEVCR
jgi:hypothetical protein